RFISLLPDFKSMRQPKERRPTAPRQRSSLLKKTLIRLAGPFCKRYRARRTQWKNARRSDLKKMYGDVHPQHTIRVH
ncbi:hypothetical protein N8Z55_06465, partial [Pseudomonadales bacterium]|nr:hypothetical protein [Pseudomonadales bacterium]